MKFLVVLVLRTAIGIVFVVSGLGKLLDISSFSVSVENYGILPHMAVFPFAIFVPIAEFTFGLMFTFNVYPRAAGYGLLTLLTVFIVAITVNLLKGNSISCGCLGLTANRPISIQILLEDIWLFLSVLLVTVLPPPPINVILRRKSLGRSMLFGIGVLIVLSVTWSDQISGIFRFTPFDSSIHLKDHQNGSLVSYGSKVSPASALKEHGLLLTLIESNRLELFLFIPDHEVKNRMIDVHLQYLDLLNRRFCGKGLNVYAILEGQREKSTEDGNYSDLSFPIITDRSGSIARFFGVPKQSQGLVIINKDSLVCHASAWIPESNIITQTIEKELFGAPQYRARRQDGTKMLSEGDVYPNVSIEDPDSGQRSDLSSQIPSFAVVGYFSSNCDCKDEVVGIEILNSFVQISQESFSGSVIGIFSSKYSASDISKRKALGKIRFRTYLTAQVVSESDAMNGSSSPIIVVLDSARRVQKVIGLNSHSDTVSSFISDSRWRKHHAR